MSKKRKKSKKIKVIYRKLGREKAVGQCYMGNNLIEVDSRAKGRRQLKILIHEISHNILPEMSEAGILKIEKTMGNTLWEQGYRKIDNN
jgi:hypothetical protein